MCRPDRTTRQALPCSIPNRGGLPANSNSSVVEDTGHLHVARFLKRRIPSAGTLVNRRHDESQLLPRGVSSILCSAIIVRTSGYLPQILRLQ